MRTTWHKAAIAAFGLLGATAGAAEARDGCGLGGHRGVYGHCRPNLGPLAYGFQPGFYGYRRFGWGAPRRFGWHRWGGYRHVGWGGGWHRGWHGGGWHHRW